MLQLIDDQTASNYYNEIDTATGDDLQSKTVALEAWANNKKAVQARQEWDHVSKVFTDFDNYSAAEGLDDFDEESRYQYANRKFIANQTGDTPENQMFVYPSKRDEVTDKMFGKTGLSEKETFDLFKNSIESRNASEEALRELPGVLAQGVLKRAGEGKPFDEVDSWFAFSDWKNRHADKLASMPKGWESAMLDSAVKLHTRTEALIADMAPESKRAMDILMKFTRPEDAADLPEAGRDEVENLAKEFAKLTPEQRDGIYATLTYAAEADGAGMGKGFWEKVGEGIARGGGNIYDDAAITAQDRQARQNISFFQDLIDKPQAEPDRMQTADSIQMQRDMAQKGLEENKQRLGELRVMREIRDLAQGRIDPIKTEMDGVLGSVVQGAYDFSQSAAYTGMAMIPYVGLPAVMGALANSNYLRMLDQYPDMDADAAFDLSLAIAGPQAVIERFQGGLLLGKLPFLGKAMKKLTDARVPIAARIGLGYAGVVGLETGTELIQEAMPVVADQLAAAVREDMPEFDAGKAWGAYRDQAPKIFYSMLWGGLMGGGAVGIRELERSGVYMRNLQELEMHGITGEAAQNIAAEQDADKATTLYREAWDKRSPDDIQAGIAKRAAMLDAAQATQENPDLPTRRIEENPDGTLTHIIEQNRQTIYSTNDPAAADLALVNFTRMVDRGRITGTTNGIVEALSFFNQVNEAAKRGDDIQKFILENTPRNLLDEYEANPTEQNLDNLFKTVATIGQNISEPAELANFPVLASNQGALAEGIFKSVIRIYEGATGDKVVRDVAQDNLKRAIAEGRIKMEWVRENLNQIIPQIDSERISQKLRTETDTDVIESFSDVALAYMRGNIRDEQIPAGLRGFLRRMAIVVKDIFRRAYKLKRLVAEGKVDANFEALLAESVGLNQQTLLDTARERVSNEVLTDTNYSIGTNPFPMEQKGKWWANEDFEQRGGRIVTMSPDQFLSQVRPLEVDEASRDNIDDLKNMMQSGRKLDPLVIYADGKEDGRHRAIAAKELGITSIPVIDFRQPVSADTGATSIGKKQDADYLAAVERGDMETAQRMVDEAAMTAGYSGSDHRMQHSAPDRESTALASIKTSGLLPNDYWQKPQFYQSMPEEWESFSVVRDALDRSEKYTSEGKDGAKVAKITVYRSVPKSVKEESIRNGDWVTPSKQYAAMEGRSIPEGYKIISQKVSLKNLWWDGNSIAELGFDDGKDYTYKNTKNNRKLIDPVTYDENGNVIPLSQRFNPRNADINYSIASQSEIDRVNRALGGMNRGPDARIAVYERAKAKFSTLLQNNQQALDNLRAGTVSFRRTQLLQALGELDAILSIFPPDIRGRVGGYTRLASIAPHDVFKDGEKVSEVSGMNGAIISAWMREGQNIGEAGKQTELPPGYTAKENLGTARSDKAIADFFKKRIEMIDRELEKTLRREYDEAFRKLLDRTKPKKAAPGEKPKGIGGDIQDLFAVVRDSVDMSATQVAAHIAGLDAMIASGELTAEQEARAQVEAALVSLTGDWKNADADRRRTALMEASRIWNGAYATHTQKLIRQREEREIARAEAIVATGKAGELAGRKSKAISDSGLKGSWKDYILNLLNFDQVVGVLFGENSEISNTIIDKQRRAENAKEDGSQAKMQELEDFFTGLAGGKVLDGERLRYRLTQPSMTVDGIKMSELEALSAVMMWSQEDGRRHMEGEMDETGKPSGKWHYNQAFVDEILANLSTEAMALRDWLGQRYASEYANINAVYSELNGVNLPQIRNYSPVTVQPVNAPTGQVLDPVSGSAMSGASTSPGALRTRGTAIAEPRFQDVLQTYISHTLQMEHWKAFAPMIAEANGILRNRDVQNSVEEKGGAEARKMLNAWLDYFAQGGTRDAGAHLALNQGLNNVLGRASQVALVGRVSTLLIQSTQLGAALAEMPVKAYLKRMGKLLTGQLGWADAINSDYIQRRMKQMPPVVQLAMQGLKGAKPTAIQQAGKQLGMLLSGADGLFTAGTYAITYDYHLTKAKELGLAGQEAEDYARNTAERVTDRIAQPTRAGARSLYENTSTNPLARAGWAFASEARKNFAIIAYSFAERDRETKMRTLAYVVALNAIGSQILRSIWRDILDDDDDELFDEKYWNPQRFLMAAATEPLYGIPVFGSMLEEAVYKSAGEYNPQTSLFSVGGAVGPIKRLPDHLSGDTDLREVMRDIDMVVSALGIMHPNIAATASITHLAKDLFNLGDSAVDAVTED